MLEGYILVKDKKVIIVGHSLNESSGLSYMAYLVAKKFYELNYDITYMNISPVNMDESGLVKYNLDTKIKILNSNIFDQKLNLVFDNYLKTNPIDLVITVHDPWLLDHVVYSAYRNTFFWVAYQTFETEKYPDNIMAPTAIRPFKDKYKPIKQILKSCNLVIPCSMTGVEALKNFDIVQNDFVYLGIDNIPDLKFINNLKEKKSSVFGNSVPDDAFIFMSVGVNNQRKRLDITLSAFAKFIHSKQLPEKNKYRLYLHSELGKNYSGPDIVELIRSLNIKEYVIIELNTVNKNILYKRFANCDCFISLYGAEGFGLPFIEALLFNKPVIYTNYSVPAEYSKNYGEGVNISSYVYPPSFCLKLAVADTEDAVDKMNNVVNSYKDREFDSYCFVKEKFNWDINFKKFYNLIISKYDIWIKSENRINLPLKRIV